jgi:hypothetical protein
MNKKMFITVNLILTTLISATVFSKEITLKGLSAKSVYDTIEANQKLEGFFDCAMGKCFLTTGAIKCIKNVTENDAILTCSIKSDDTVNPTKIILSSKDDGVTTLAPIRYVLVQAAGSEKKINSTTKELKIKNLSCASVGLSHVLDSFDYEPTYTCKINL